MLWLKLAAVGLFIAAIWGAIHSHDAAQQAIGAGEIKAQLAEQQAKQAADDQRIAEEGKAAAYRLAAASKQRLQAQAAQVASDALARKAASDARAADDKQYALWREQPVPQFESERLRQLVALGLADAPHPVVPGRAPVPAQPDSTVIAQSADQSGLGRLRVILGRDVTVGAQARGTGQK